MFTPLKDTFEYQHIMKIFDDQCDTDKEMALFNSKQRSDIVANQIKENKKLVSSFQEAFNMALSAQNPNSQHNSQRQDDTLQTQLNSKSRTIADLATHLTQLEGTPPTNTTISQSDTSRTRESRKTNTSALTDTTDRSTSATYHRDCHSHRDATNHSSRERTRSPSDSQQHYRSPPHWESSPSSNPTDDYSATPIQSEDILLWIELSLPTHKNPSARYISRIYEVPRAMVEHNRLSTTFTTEWRRKRTTNLKAMIGNLPHHLNTVQQSILHLLSTYLRTTSHLELGYSLAHKNDSTKPQNIWPVTFPLCDPSSYLQSDIANFDFHLLPKLMKIRNCSARKIRHDKITHGNSQLHNSENMLNAQDMYNHIRRYSNDCFLHTAYELILDTLYLVLQNKMIAWRNSSLMYYPPATLAAPNRSRKCSSNDIDVDAVTE